MRIIYKTTKKLLHDMKEISMTFVTVIQQLFDNYVVV